MHLLLLIAFLPVVCLARSLYFPSNLTPILSCPRLEYIVATISETKPVGITEDESPYHSDASSDVSVIFSEDESGSKSNSDPETESDDSDDDDIADNFYINKGQLPPEYYLAEAEALDVS